MMTTRPPPDPALDAEAEAALARAAKLAGDAALVPKLAALVDTYINDRQVVGTAPKLGRLHQALRAHALAAEALRRELADPWQREAVVGAQGLIGIDLDGLDYTLGELARRARVGASTIPSDGRASADRRPGSPSWRFAWSLADLWSDTGHYVGIGVDTLFFAFASEAFAAAGKTAPERLLREVAERWRENSRTAEAQKPPVVSLRLAS